MKTFSRIILSPKVTILHFSHKNVGMISHTLYFFYNNSLLHGHENNRTLIFVVIDFDPEKIERKGGARFLAFSIYQDCPCWSFKYVIVVVRAWLGSHVRQAQNTACGGRVCGFSRYD